MFIKTRTKHTSKGGIELAVLKEGRGLIGILEFIRVFPKRVRGLFRIKFIW